MMEALFSVSQLAIDTNRGASVKFRLENPQRFIKCKGAAVRDTMMNEEPEKPFV
jgi:hypothetical protein